MIILAPSNTCGYNCSARGEGGERERRERERERDSVKIIRTTKLNYSINFMHSMKAHLFLGVNV
jgi:hypothetical protein